MLERLRTLARNLAIYGLGDVATNIVSFLLLPLYVHFLTPADYGAIALLYTVEIVAKIVFRWGIDASFMRFWYDCESERDRQRLASTVFWFLFGANGLVLVAGLAAAPFVTSRLFGLPGYELPLRLVLVNTFVIGFYFLPFHVLRIRERSTQFSILTTTRAAATLVARFVLIVGFELGVLGFVLADILVTAVFTVVLARWFAPLLRFTFSRRVLAECLGFGLPRVPHGVAQQVTAVSDRYFLAQFAGLGAVGLYSVGASFGQAMKLFMSAFEYAWAPFYFATMKEPDAKATFRTVTTYGVAVLALLEAGLAAVSTDVVRLMTKPEFEGAAVVIPWIGLGLVFHGFYLLTSIGLNITKQTRFYPVATTAAAAASLTGNLLLVPTFGALGAAWTNAIAYAVLAGVAFVLSQRVYPYPLEWGRLLRLALAAAGAWLLAIQLPATLSPLAGLLARGLVVCAAYPVFLLVLGFYDRRELRTVGRIVARLRARRVSAANDAGAAAPLAAVPDVDGPVEAGGVILEVPLTQDDLLEPAETPASTAVSHRPTEPRPARAAPAEPRPREGSTGGTHRARRTLGAGGTGALVTLAAIAALAAWLRMQGLGFGLPAVYNPDEIAIMSRALAFAKGDLNPHNFLYPTFYFYGLFAWVGAYGALLWTFGGVPSIAAFQTQFFLDPSGVYLAGRMLGVVCGVATVGAVYALGRALAGTRTGLVAALFLAVAPTAVRDAHYVKHDVPVTLAIVLASVAIVKLTSGFRLRATGFGPGLQPAARSLQPTLFLASALSGVAFSTHYYAVFLVLPLALAIYLTRRDAGWGAVVRDLLMAALTVTTVFFALSPFLLVEPRTAWQDIVANRQIVMDRAVTGGGGVFASASAYLRLLWTEAVGWPVLLASLAGGALLLRDQPRTAVLLLAFPIPFLAFISNTVAASRYLNPVLPFIAVLAGYAVVRAVGFARGSGALSRGPGALAPGSPPPSWTTEGLKPRGYKVAAVALLLALPGLRLSDELGRFFQQTDTRTLAQQFIERHVPRGATILVQPYSVQLVQSKAGLREALTHTGHDPDRASARFAMRLALDPYPSPAYRTIFLGDGGLDADKIYVSPGALGGAAGLDALTRLGVEYVVLKRYNTEDLASAPLRAALADRGRLLAAFSPWRPDADARSRALVTPFLHNTDTPYDRALERPGPGIEVWVCH